MNTKLYLILYNKDKKFQFTKYFETEWKMDKYKRKLPYIKNLVLIEDSRDIYFLGVIKNGKQYFMFYFRGDGRNNYCSTS